MEKPPEIELQELIVKALALADALGLTDVALKLDSARVRLEGEALQTSGSGAKVPANFQV